MTQLGLPELVCESALDRTEWRRMARWVTRQYDGSGSSPVECRTSNRKKLGFEYYLLPFRSLAFSFSPRHPSSLSCINEYLAIDSGGNVSDLVFARNYAWLEWFPENPSWCRNEHVCQEVKCKALCAVQRTG